jgi:peptide/nickel transport system permease protein
VTRHILKRCLLLIPTLWGIATLVFLMLQLVPGDPARVLAGPEADAQTIATIRHNLKLDRPLIVQYGSFLARAVQGDLGTSFATHRPVTEEILARYPRTVALAFCGLGIALLFGISLGVISAIKPYSLLDNAGSILSLLGISMPGFWVGLMLIYVFGVQLHILPVVGLSSPKHLLMPAFVLSFFSMALLARMTRSGMIEVLQQDYIVTARAKGLRPRVVLLRHALKNALIPVVTVAALSVGNMLGGSVVIETVFSINGVGQLVVDSILRRDYPVVQGAVLFIAFNFVIVNLALDIAYAYVDPRIRFD